MTITVKEMDSLEGWSNLVGDYLRKIRKISDEKQITEVIETFAKHLDEKERYAVVAFKEEKPIGYLTGRKYGIVFETSSFYLDEEAIKENVGAKLVDALTKKVFDELGFKYFRQNIMLPFEFGSTFKEDLMSKGFQIFDRCEMKVNPMEAKLEPSEMHSNYTFEPFKKDRVEEIIGVMCSANEPGHPDLVIYPEMKEVKTTMTVFARFTKNWEALDPALNPQITKNNEIAGMSIVLRDNPKRAYIAEMAVHPDHQRKGLGKNLMKRIFDECSKQEITDLLLAVSKDNVGAFKLYQKLGFEEIRQYLAITKEKNEKS
ncbi:MAG: GNAT family N-acetyltransferase [Candidatus Heimdallarchaeota archaeon]